MANTNMTSEPENAFHADPDNQTPQEPPVRRKAKLSEPVPVRSPEGLLREVRHRAAADDRSASNWIRRAVEHELTRGALDHRRIPIGSRNARSLSVL